MVKILVVITDETYSALSQRAKKENKKVERIAQEILAHETNTRVDIPVFKSYKEMQENK